MARESQTYFKTKEVKFNGQGL